MGDSDWKAIEEFPNYEINTDGTVRNVKRGTILAQNIRTGYRVVNLWKNNKMYIRMVHRLVAKAFIPNPENKPQINHIDGNRTNNALDNLEWCTQSENNIHAVQVLNRPSATGEKHGMTTLTTNQVRAIRERYKTGQFRYSDLAKEYGVSTGTINNILNKRTWGSTDV